MTINIHYASALTDAILFRQWYNMYSYLRIHYAQICCSTDTLCSNANFLTVKSNSAILIDFVLKGGGHGIKGRNLAYTGWKPEHQDALQAFAYSEDIQKKQQRPSIIKLSEFV